MEDKYLIIIDKKLVDEYHQEYIVKNPKCRSLPFAKRETIKLFNKDGTPKLTKGGKQATKKQAISRKDYSIDDCMYGVMSLNELLVIPNRIMMNAKKTTWGNLGVWIAEKYGFSDLKISNSMMEFRIYSETKALKDNDNIVAGVKLLNDGMLVKSGMYIDDNYNHINPLLINCSYDALWPRTEIRISVFEDKLKDVYEKMRIHAENFKEGDN